MKREALLLAFALLAGSGCSQSPITGPDTAEPLAKGVIASLSLDRSAIGVGETLIVELQVRNHRHTAVDLVSANFPLASVHTVVNGESILLVGGTNPSLPMVTTVRILPGDAHVQGWHLVAERYEPRGAPPPVGVYELTVRIGYAVDGADWETAEFTTTFTLRE